MTIKWRAAYHTAIRPVRFYRAMLCIARTVLSQDVRPSVRLSVCWSHASILSKQLNVSSKFFSPSGSHSILVFLHQTVMTIFWQGPSNGSVEWRRYERITIARLSANISLYLGNDTRCSHRYDEMRIGNHCRNFRMIPLWMTLSDLDCSDLAIYSNIARSLCDSWASCYVYRVIAGEILLSIALVRLLTTLREKG